MHPPAPPFPCLHAHDRGDRGDIVCQLRQVIQHTGVAPCGKVVCCGPVGAARQEKAGTEDDKWITERACHKGKVSSSMVLKASIQPPSNAMV